MAKSKTRKSQKQKQMVENEVLVYIYSLVLITLSIIGGLQIGFIGELTTSIIKYVFGNLYGVIYGVIIVLCVMMMLKKSVRDVPMKYLIGIGVLLCAWIIAASIPQNETLKGMDILSRYLQDSMLIFRGEIAAKGGLIGAFLVSLCTFLFDYKGTWIIVIALLILALILLLSGSGFARLKAGAVSLAAPFVSMRKNHAAKGDARRERKQQVKKEKKEQEAEPKEAKSMFGKINIDERVRPGQVSFLDVDDDFDIQSDGRSTAFLADKEHALEEESDVLDKQAFKEAENKRIIEDTIGGEDTFVSSFQEDWSKYKLPRLTLLKDAGKKSRSTANVSAANDAGRQLIEILDQFGVKATLVATHIGPAVTKFEVKPDLGVRVNKISNLQYDIKMALAAKDIRIEAPIPGKSAVGIEIPNVEKKSVSMKELMKNIPDKLAQSKMLFALGKDLMGNCVYGELNRMPHLLIAGATGSGKSVCVNSIITSILMRARPDEVKLLLVDPKKVEFTPYKEIPHLLGPVITDGDEANRALKVIVTMMDNRYELFSMAGVRNIAGYNAYIEAHPEEGLSPLPWVVVIIDELADLMLVAAKEVEASIQRITQLARAAGIHLIVATQRPSVDVITGIIKANIPSRIAFAVSSAVDSRTILDQMGAEKLLGYGDMLYVPVGETVATRVQGVFVSDDEVSDICEFVSRQGKPKFDDAFVRLELLDGGVGPTSSETGDPLYDEVKEFIISTRKASTSLIQRKFSIGYARAARLIDTLEDNGIIGPARGSKPREVYAKSEQAEEE
ncbi:DNA translocase FtsK [[Clostridium] innocuum]|uniref:DNA translocase FtsK n=1 Tax=Clostridium innocuum TaxID=1522 RepID=UPI0006BF508A|nr:DNA translocase FtsK [[Clostridium] innocuum]CUQ90496.1 DNA segregation ATPase FtsK [[Clostridium] innocuum]